MLGAFCATTGIVTEDGAGRGHARVDPAVPDPTHRSQRARPAGRSQAPARRRVPGLGDGKCLRKWSRSRAAAPSPSTSSTARVATSASRPARRACSRCRRPSTTWATRIRSSRPVAPVAAACLYVCPDFVFEVYRFEQPVVTEVDRSDPMTATTDTPRRERARADGGLGGARPCRHRGRLSLLRGLPDDTVHRGARELRSPAPRRGRRVHQRGVGAGSGRHGVGRAAPPVRVPRPVRRARASR